MPHGTYISRKEAAHLTGASASVINKAIEQGLLATRQVQKARLLDARDVLALAWFKQDLPLAVVQKKRIRSWVRQGAEGELTLGDGFVVRVDGLVQATIARVQRYVDLRDRFLEIDRDTRGGEPVLRGTRVPIRGLAKQVKAGETMEILRDDFPDLPDEAFEFVVQWADANPKRGRPTRSERSEPAGRAAALKAREQRRAVATA